MYAFQVKAEIPDAAGEDAYSTTIEKMPLSTRSFAPWVREVGHQSITIEWWNNSNVSEYMVERSVSPEGPWEVRRLLSAVVFTDTQVDHDTEYFYRITPVEYEDITSEYQGAIPARFGLDDKFAYTDTDGTAADVAVSGSYAYVADGDAGLQIIKLTGGPE